MFISRRHVGVLAMAAAVLWGAGRAMASSVEFGFNVSVDGTVTKVTDGFQYDYSIVFTPIEPTGVVNPSVLPDSAAVGLTLPFFDPASVAFVSGDPILDPAGWAHLFVAANTSNWPLDDPSSSFDNPPYVLRWFSTESSSVVEDVIGVVPSDVVGFEFTSPYGPGDGPAIVTLGEASGLTPAVDPPLPVTPGSPLAVAPAPEPLTALTSLAALGAAGLAAMRRRR